MSELRLAWKHLIYALRGGQQDALNELSRYEEMHLSLHALGADVPARLHDAVILELCGFTDDDLTWMCKAKASGRLAELMQS